MSIVMSGKNITVYLSEKPNCVCYFLNLPLYDKRFDLCSAVAISTSDKTKVAVGSSQYLEIGTGSLALCSDSTHEQQFTTQSLKLKNQSALKITR